MAEGGVLDSDCGYSFGSNQGLRLESPGIAADHYSIGIEFSLDSVNPTSGWHKILDFDDRQIDTGLYVYLEGTLCFYALNFYEGPPGTFQAQVLSDLLITRDGTTRQVRVFVDGVEQISFIDSLDEAVVGVDSVLTFFEDDAETQFRETGSGFVSDIEVFDGPTLPTHEWLEDLAQEVLLLDLAKGLSTSLDAKLERVLNALDDVNANNDIAACNSLTAFAGAVEAQRDKEISEEEADSLLESAFEILGALECNS
jgi:hypothetical protein